MLIFYGKALSRTRIEFFEKNSCAIDRAMEDAGKRPASAVRNLFERDAGRPGVGGTA